MVDLLLRKVNNKANQVLAVNTDKGKAGEIFPHFLILSVFWNSSQEMWEKYCG